MIIASIFLQRLPKHPFYCIIYFFDKDESSSLHISCHHSSIFRANIILTEEPYLLHNSTDCDIILYIKQFRINFSTQRFTLSHLD